MPGNSIPGGPPRPTLFWLSPIVGAFVADKWLRAIVNLPLSPVIIGYWKSRALKRLGAGSVAQARRHGFGALAETEGKAMPFDGVGLGFDDRMYKIDRVTTCSRHASGGAKEGSVPMTGDTAFAARSWQSMG